MPFELCNAGTTFKRFQLKVFGPYIGKFIHVYLDGFAVYGDRRLHFCSVRAIFERFAHHECFLYPEKCKVSFEQRSLLGQVVFSGRHKIDLKKNSTNSRDHEPSECGNSVIFDGNDYIPQQIHPKSGKGIKAYYFIDSKRRQILSEPWMCKSIRLCQRKVS